MVPSLDEIKALSLEELSFDILDVIKGSGMPLDDDFKDPPSRNLVPKVVSPPKHSSILIYIESELDYWFKSTSILIFFWQLVVKFKLFLEY